MGSFIASSKGDKTMKILYIVLQILFISCIVYEVWSTKKLTDRLRKIQKKYYGLTHKAWNIILCIVAINATYLVFLPYIQTIVISPIQKQGKIKYMYTNVKVFAIEPGVTPIPDLQILFPTPTPSHPLTVKEQVHARAIKEWGTGELNALDNLLMSESGYNQFATNGESGACGIFQAYPCSKLGCNLQDVDCQINWGFAYIKRTYGTPSNAWAFKREWHYLNGIWQQYY